MDYKNKLESMCPPEGTEYLARYFTLLDESDEIPKNQYGEWHHLLPVSVFPELKNKKLNPWNQKRISAKAHFIAHYLLHKALHHKKMTSAWLYMFAQARHLDEWELDGYADEYAATKAKLNYDTSRGKVVVVTNATHAINVVKEKASGAVSSVLNF